MILGCPNPLKYHADVIVSHRPPLADTFYFVKNVPEMRYHVCVILSRRRDLAPTALTDTLRYFAYEIQ